MKFLKNRDRSGNGTGLRKPSGAAISLLALLLAASLGGCTAPGELEVRSEPQSQSEAPVSSEAPSSSRQESSSFDSSVSSEASSLPDVVYNVETVEVPNMPVSKESFLEYFDASWFPRFFAFPVKDTQELAGSGSGFAFLFAVYQTLLLEAERGVTFEMTEEGHYLIPGEMIRRTAWELLGLELTADELFAMSGGKECSPAEPFNLSRIAGTDNYCYYNAFGLAEGMEDTILEDTLRFTEQEISIQTTWWTHDHDPNIPLRRFTYDFRVVEGNRIPYQLVRITED